MTIREFKAIDKQLGQLKRKLVMLKSKVVNVSPALSGMPGGSDVSDKIGKCITEISDTEKRIEELETEKHNALSRLSKDIDEEVCIHLFLVKNCTWRMIADITENRLDTVASIKKRCYKHNW